MDTSYAVKGSVVRAHIACLRKANLFDAVVSRVEQAAADCLRNPPLAGSWVDANLLADVTDAVHQLGGDKAVLDLSRAVVTEQSVHALIPMVQGILRIFGASPASLYGRFGDLVRTSTRGLEFAYAPLTDRSGTMTVSHATARSLRRASFLTSVAPLELVLKLCGVRGTVGMPELQGSGRARFRIDW